MNNITNPKVPGNVALRPSAPQKPSSSPQSQAFSKPNIPQQVTSLTQQLLQSAKEGKAEHADHLPEHLNSIEDDFYSELNEHADSVHSEERDEAGHRNGGNQEPEDEEQTEDADERIPVAQMPVAVAGGGVTVGQAQVSDAHPAAAHPIPDNRVIAIQGQNYTVAFLKRQVGNYASSSFANSGQDADGSALAQAAVNTPWGGATMAGSASQFEAYIKAAFPHGDPGLPANPAVRYEGSALIVNGQVYGADLNNPKLVGSVDSFLIGNSPEHQAEARQVLNNFTELKIMNDLSQADGSSSYLVSVPSEYRGQWQAALLDNLPAGSTVQAAT